MGRKTYFGVPESKRPLPERFNVVLTTEPEKYEFPSEVIVVKSMDEALAKLSEPDLKNQIENVWIVGGHSVYKLAMESPQCHRIYFTKIMAEFDCDAFFPTIPDSFKLISNDDDIPSEVQEENGIKYQYQIYEKVVLWLCLSMNGVKHGVFCSPNIPNSSLNVYARKVK